MADWRRFGWQQIAFSAPADWFLTKVSIERAEGELYLNDQTLPRLQIKWLDASREKSVNPKATLDRWIQQLEREAKKRRTPFEAERDIKLVSRGKRDVSSLECFRWQADVESFGLIWYSPAAQRVTLAQVNGQPGEPGLRTLARQVLGSLRDAPDGEDDLWTAYDLECRVPRDFRLTSLIAQTGHTELVFERRRDKLSIGRWGLASIVIERHGNLGDWAFQQRFRSWIAHAVERTESPADEPASVTFEGRRRSVLERFRSRVYNFFGADYTVALSARAWHCPEANCLYLVEHLRDARSAPLAQPIAEMIPCVPSLVPPPKS